MTTGERCPVCWAQVGTKLRLCLPCRRSYDRYNARDSATLDTTYVMAVEMGIDLEPFFDEVHNANMRKVGGPISPEGKQLKPEGWRSPDIAAVFRKCYGVDP